MIKAVWAFEAARIALRFASERRGDDSHGFRGHGNATWAFAVDGRMAVRHASLNDPPIAAADRKVHGPLGRRPDDHPGLADLGL